MKYLEAYNNALEEMDKHYFDEIPDKSFEYFLFKQNMKKYKVQDEMNIFLARLDELKFYEPPKNKEDNKCAHLPENLLMLWNALKVSCFIISIPELNYKDLNYHNIHLSLGTLYQLNKRFRDALPLLSDHLQTIVLNIHPDSVKEIQYGDKYKFFRASKSESALEQHVSPSFVKRPLTFT